MLTKWILFILNIHLICWFYYYYYKEGLKFGKAKTNFNKRLAPSFFIVNRGPRLMNILGPEKKILLGEFPLFEDFVTTLHKDHCTIDTIFLVPKQKPDTCWSEFHVRETVLGEDHLYFCIYQLCVHYIERRRTT